MKEKHIKAYMKCAEAFAECSVGERLKVGAVLVKNNRIISCGYNALPAYINGKLEDENGVTRPEVRHAEKNALLGLVKSNESATDSVLFCTHSCCKLCAIDIVDAGIKRVYYKHQYRLLEGIEHLRQNGVEVIHLGETNETIPNPVCSCRNSRPFSSLLDNKATFDADRAARETINREWKDYPIGLSEENRVV